MPKKDFTVRNFRSSYQNPHTLCNHQGKVLRITQALLRPCKITVRRMRRLWGEK